MTESMLPLGKLPPDVLARMLARAPLTDERVLLGPGVGLDCAVVEMGDRMLVFKSDPITFASDKIGWYAVQVCANDIATTGAKPRWFMPTVLFPEKGTDVGLVDNISNQVFDACRELDISVIGGHTEITHGLDRPIIMGTLIGEVAKDKLITPRGAQPGDRLLLTKGVPIEATAILAREFPDRLLGELTPSEIDRAAGFLFDPGISVVRDAQIAVAAGRVTGMHDPTEGGLAGALWEMSEACNYALTVDLSAINIPELAGRVCHIFGLDPLATIASGALLLTVNSQDGFFIQRALKREGIDCVDIGSVEKGVASVRCLDGEIVPRPARDEIARVYEA
jgi:hydrogenase expression/formation protein HypE